MIGRDQAFQLLKKYLRDEKLIKHSLAVEAIMRELAVKLRKDENLWGLTGLLHDLDYEYTHKEPEKHASMAADMLEGLLPEKALNAIRSHNYKHSGQIPTSPIDKGLIASDAVSGLIIATALVMPSKKLADVSVESLNNKFYDKSFAKGCNRNRIELCQDAGIDLDAFLVVSLHALKGIAEDLGL